MDEENKKKRVLVGMSGGVDSSVAAAILKGQGYEVAGIFLRFWKEKEDGESRSLEDAKKVARILDINLHVADVRERFRKIIVDDFIHEYENGRTPNPCVICNREMKFKILLEKMEEIGMDFVATGHYAIIKKSEILNSKSETNESSVCKIFAAKDENKDQSYFLYRLTQEELSRIIFPLGEYEKREVRNLAESFGLPVFAKEESQDVCFISGSVSEFLKKNLKSKEGYIQNEKGERVGTHKGLPFYTIGQRKGINIGGDGPYFVVGKDAKNNVLIVANNPEKKEYLKKEIMIGSVTWTSDVPMFPVRFLARTRYRNHLVYATIEPKKSDENHIVIFDEPQKAVSSGQSLVFYSDDGEVAGGGIIE